MRRQDLEEGSMASRIFPAGEWHEAERLLAKIGSDIKADGTKGSRP